MLFVAGQAPEVQKLVVISASLALLAIIGLILALCIKISPLIVENQDHLVLRN